MPPELAPSSADPVSPPGEVIIALGSNLGDSTTVLAGAMDALDRLAARPVRRSSLWQSTPVDCPPGSPLFVNAVVVLTPRAGETPESLLEKLQELEREFGRRPKRILNEPRPLDLDLIAFGSEERHSEQLTLPHPRACVRRFVLAPLAEVAPGLVLPGRSATVREMLEALHTDEVVRRLGLHGEVNESRSDRPPG